MTKKTLYHLLLLVLITVSCVKNDMDNCETGFRLQFRYNLSGGDRDLPPSVRHISLYLFDQRTGILSDIHTLNAQEIARGYVDLEVPEGLYTVIAWATNSTDMTLAGYAAAHADGTVHTPVAVGATTLNHFRMMLAHNPLQGNPLAEVTARVLDFGDLYYAAARDIAVVLQQESSATLRFIRNTSTLHVEVSGLENLPGLRSDQAFEIFTTGANKHYIHSNAFATGAQRMLYLPQSLIRTTNNIESFVKQQRLYIGQRTDDPVMLYLTNPATGENIVTLNLLDVIMRNPAYQTQAAIDAQERFDISIDFGYNLTVTIIINGWQAETLTPNL
jgi:hypothetical protein